MVPLQLSLKNFLSYRDETAIDFSTIRIACLSGDNGAGKSALLDAITWALWGKTRASSDRDVVSIGAVEMEVTFVFRLGDREYRVFRRRSTSGAGRHTIELQVRVSGDDSWTTITGDSVRHSQEKINQLLCMEYDTFVHSAFILQGKADSFTEKPPAERKKILGEILNLQEYDDLGQMARQEERSLRESLSEIQGRMETLDAELSGRAEVLDELSVRMIELTDLGQKLDLAEQLAQSLRLQLQSEELIQRQIDEVAILAERDAKSLAAMRRELADTEHRRDGFFAALEEAGEIERGWAQLEHWRAEVGRMAALGRDDQAQAQVAHDAQRAIDAEEAMLRRAADAAHLRAQNASARIDELNQQEARLAALQADLEAAGDPSVRLAEVGEHLEAMRGDYSSVQAENNQLKAQVKDIADNLVRLDAADAICPTCRRPLSEHDRDHIRDDWFRDSRSREERRRANEATLLQIKRAAAQLKTNQQALERVAHENTDRLGRIELIRGQLAGRDALVRALAEARAELDSAAALLARGDVAAEARARLDAAVAARREIGYDARAAEQAARMEREHAPFAQRKAALVEAQAGASQAEALIRQISGQLVEREASYAEMIASLEQMRRDNPRDPELRDRCDVATDEAGRLLRDKNALLERQGWLQGRVADLDRLQDQRDDLDKEATALALDHGATRALVDAFGRNGIQAMIVEGVLPELEDEANRLLRQMSTGQLEVSFRSQRQAQSRDSIIETLDIVIRDEIGERPYALFSGGEAFRVNFAVRVALSKLLARRAGASIDMLVIDEGFGTQDSRGRDGLIEALRSIEEDFQTILVITHIGEIRELFPTRIDVVKTERGSQVTVC